MRYSQLVIEKVQCDHDCCRDDGIFEDDVIKPMSGKRCFRLGHGAASFATRVLAMVVLASHSLPRATVLRRWGTKPRRLKKSCALSLTSAVKLLAPRAAASFSSASINIPPTPCPAAAGCT